MKALRDISNICVIFTLYLFKRVSHSKWWTDLRDHTSAEADDVLYFFLLSTNPIKRQELIDPAHTEPYIAYFSMP